MILNVFPLLKLTGGKVKLYKREIGVEVFPLYLDDCFGKEEGYSILVSIWEMRVLFKQIGKVYFRK